MKSFLKSSLTGILVTVLVSSPAFAGNKAPKIKDVEQAQSKKTIQSAESSQLDKEEKIKIEPEQTKIKEDERTFNIDGTLTEKEHVKIITVQNHL